MDLRDELIDAMAALKQEIQHATHAAVASFEARTGLTPSKIHIDLMDVTNYTDPMRRSAVAEIRVDLERF